VFVPVVLENNMERKAGNDNRPMSVDSWPLREGGYAFRHRDEMRTKPWMSSGENYREFLIAAGCIREYTHCAADHTCMTIEEGTIMLVRDIMTKHVEYVPPGASLEEAAQRMRDLNIGSLPVGENDRLVGMLTDRDMTIRAVADGRNPQTTTARDAMSPTVVYVFDDQDITEAADVMKEKKIRRLIVLNHDRRMVGICSLGDLTEDELTAGDVLKEIAQPNRVL
jgi:CBS domain-containing protein